MSIKRSVMLLVSGAALTAAVATPSFAASDQASTDTPRAHRAAQIIVHPRNRPLGPNAVRECQAWLEKEYRVSGPVIVPRERCYWR
jgi:hypothetical protein